MPDRTVKQVLLLAESALQGALVTVKSPGSAKPDAPYVVIRIISDVPAFTDFGPRAAGNTRLATVSYALDEARALDLHDEVVTALEAAGFEDAGSSGSLHEDDLVGVTRDFRFYR